MENMQSINNGQVYEQSVDGWDVSWESNGIYRHWCHQIKNNEWDNLLVVMFNPGSLSGSGSNLRKDTTLRILRNVCAPARLNPYIVNLFDYASPSTNSLFNNWHIRDSDSLIFDKLELSKFRAFVMAYGNYENRSDHGQDIRVRVELIRVALGGLQEIILPKNSEGTPKHPMRWQREKTIPKMASLLCSGCSKS